MTLPFISGFLGPVYQSDPERGKAVPILVAPTAFHSMAYSEGEVATARAAGKAKTIMRLCGCRAVDEIDKDILF